MRVGVIAKFILAVFLSVQTTAQAKEITLKTVSDSEIQDFLGKFIKKSVENVQMLVEFVVNLLRNAMSSLSLVPINNINKITHIENYHATLDDT